MTDTVKRLKTENLVAEIYPPAEDGSVPRLVTLDFGLSTVTICECHADELAKLLGKVLRQLGKNRIKKLFA